MADEIDLVSDIAAGDLDGAAGPIQAPPGTVPAAGGVDAVPANEAPAKITDKPSSLRDQLSAAFKGEDGGPTDQANATSAGEQTRNADGTYGPKAAATPEQGALDAAAALAATATGADAPAFRPEAWGMSPAEAQQFTALPQETQQFVARITGQVEQAAARYVGYDGIEQVIGPRRQAWAMNGMSEPQAINQLLALSDFAGKSPVDFVQWFAGQHGIDLAQMIEQGDLDDDLDPAVQELRQQVQQLTGQLTSISQGQQQAAHDSIVSNVSQFAAEVGTDGQPLRPHFAELGGAILPYIQAVKAENPQMSHTDILAKAYDNACWGTPSVRAKLVAAQDAERLATARADAARAKAAGASVTGDAPSPGATVPKDSGSGSVRDTLKAAFAAST